MPETTQEELVELLVKVSHTPSNQPLTLSEPQALALKSYLRDRLCATDLSPREQAFCKQVATRLDGMNTNPLDRERANWILRSGINKCEARQYTEVSTQELALMRSTLAQLGALPAPSPGHQRLEKKIADALAAYQTSHPGVDVGTDLDLPIEAPPAGVAHSPEDLFSGLNPQKITDLAGYTVNFNLRVVEHVGNLTVTGDVPEDGLLLVKGGVTIKGAVAGHVHGKHGIWVDGNVQGGYLVSDQGDIFCGKLLGGSHLVAPAGSVRIESAERSPVIFAGKHLRIDGNATADQVWAKTITLGGTLRADETQCLGQIWANRVEPLGPKKPRVSFRNALSTTETGRRYEDHAPEQLKEHLRLYIRKAVSSTMLERATDDYRLVLLLILYAAKSDENTHPSPIDLREMQLRFLFYSVFSAGGMSFAHALRVVNEVGAGKTKSLGIAVEDEALQAAAFIERECARISPELAGNAKQDIQIACRHLNNLARKVKSTVVEGTQLSPIMDEVVDQTATWQALKQEASNTRRTWKPEVDSLLGNKIADPDLPLNKLEVMAKTIAGEVLPTRQSKIIKALQSVAEYYQRVLDEWDSGVQGNTDWLQDTNQNIQSSGTFVLAEQSEGERFIQANGLLVGLEIRHWCQRFKPLTLETAIEQPTRFVCGNDGVEAVQPS